MNHLMMNYWILNLISHSLLLPLCDHQKNPSILPSPTNSVIDFISFSSNHDLFNELLNDFHPPTPIPSENLNTDLEHTQKDLNKDLQLDDEIQLDLDALSDTISSFQNFVNNNSLVKRLYLL
ncbi:hypothetical protein A2U01_0025768 [Trifolium medium]|uniref:Uncharacterized protein n=1 Tax=Trifolium medium TaxID=97028 RepID=A0A392NY50_9FABA|nr:hypothetical protein [Trifolium medium]